VDDVPVEKIKDFQEKVTEFFTNRKADLLKKIGKEKAISDALAAELKTAFTEFKQTYDIGKSPAAPAKAKAEEAPKSR
jgi:F-type H+-transporting ATPase subunit alpha